VTLQNTLFSLCRNRGNRGVTHSHHGYVLGGKCASSCRINGCDAVRRAVLMSLGIHARNMKHFTIISIELKNLLSSPRLSVLNYLGHPSVSWQTASYYSAKKKRPVLFSRKFFALHYIVLHSPVDI
jgi:hypothetical protein